MEIKILWFYHDILDLYGDSGNIKVLKYRCLKRNIKVVIDYLYIGQYIDISEYDLLFVGGGADLEQNMIYKDLLKYKKDIIKSINNGCFLLLICGGYQLFGQYYIDQNDNKIDGLGIFDYYTIGNKKDRCIGNVLVDCLLDGQKIEVLGFENHAGETFINTNNVLGKIIVGNGNQYKGLYEGYYDGQCLGTYLHGPLLPKNPILTDFIILKALSKRYKDVKLEPLDDTFENKAFNIMKKRISI